MSERPDLYLIFGDDEFPVSVKAREIVDELVPPAERTFGLETIDGRADNIEQAVSAVQKCTEALQTPGFLGAGKATWLSDVNFLSETVVGRSKVVKEAVSDLTAILKEGLSGGQALVISAQKVDKRSALYKVCKEKAELHEFSMPTQSHKADEQARAYAAAEAKRLRLKVPGDALYAFVERVGTDSRQITGELDKLALYLGDRRDVGIDDITEIVCASRELVIWDLGDAVGERDLVRGLKTLRQLLFQKESPVGLVISLQNRLNELMICREALDNGWLVLGGSEKWVKVAWHVPARLDDAFSQLGRKDPRSMHPYRAGRLAMQARRSSLRELTRCRDLAIQAHQELVSGDISDPLVLELLLIRMAGRKRRR